MDLCGNSIWAFLLLMLSRKEYFLRFKDLSKNHHTAHNILNVIFNVIDQVGSNKFMAIVSDNASNVTAARCIIMQKYPNININCIVHCVNLISCDYI